MLGCVNVLTLSTGMMECAGRGGVYKTCGIRVNMLSPFLPFFFSFSRPLFISYFYDTHTYHGLSYTWWKITIESSFAFSHLATKETAVHALRNIANISSLYFIWGDAKQHAMFLDCFQLKNVHHSRTRLYKIEKTKIDSGKLFIRRFELRKRD